MNDNSDRSLAVENARQIDVLCDEFERQMAAGTHPRIESFRDRVPDSQWNDLLFELLGLELEHLRRQGGSPSREEYERRFPNDRAVVLRAFTGDVDTDFRDESGVTGTVAVTESFRPGGSGSSRPELPEFLERVRSSKLIEEVVLSDCLGQLESAGPASAKSVADQLVGAGHLTPWQANRLLGRESHRLLIGRYRLLDKLGEGGMGTVFRAAHTMIEHEVALKVLRGELARDPGARKRFLKEAQACVKLTHPNIVTTHGVDEDDGVVFITMALLDGVDLARYVRQHGPMETNEALDAIRQASAGLDYAHQKGIIHRDIKPHNLLRETDGAIKILDLGLARLLEGTSTEEMPSAEAAETPAADRSVEEVASDCVSRLTRTGALMGTLAYMSPEQIVSASRADGRSDIYSLGCTLYYLLTGEHAFAGDDPTLVIGRHLRAEFTPLHAIRPELPDGVDRLFQKMIAPEQADRYSTVTEVIDDIRRIESSLRREAAARDMGDAVEAKRRTALESERHVAKTGSAQGARVSKRMPETLEQLKATLLELGLITANDLDAAVASAKEESQLSWHGASVIPSRTTMVVDEYSTDPVSLLMRLQRQRTGASLETCLTDLQVRQIIAGHADSLRLPHHVLLDKIGHGWKGEVFKARNLKAGRIEAVRTFAARALEGLAGEPEEREAAFHEAVRALSQVPHPIFAPYHESGSYETAEHGEVVYVASEFVRGQSLWKWMDQAAKRGELPPASWTIERVSAIADGLVELHRLGLCHGDLSPHAIMTTDDDWVKVIDHGLSKLLIADRDTGLTTQARLVGTPMFMPPEQWMDRHGISPASDIYNLGCTFFYLLTGRYPFEETNVMELFQAHMRRSPFESEAGKSIPTALRPILHSMLAKNPTDRCSASAIVEELRLQRHHVSPAPQQRVLAFSKLSWKLGFGAAAGIALLLWLLQPW